MNLRSFRAAGILTLVGTVAFLGIASARRATTPGAPASAAGVKQTLSVLGVSGTRPGQPILLLYVSPSCSHCHSFVPDFVSLASQEELADSVVIVIVSADSAFPVVRASDALWVVDSGGSSKASLGIRGTPYAMLISPTMEIVGRWRGGTGVPSALIDTVKARTRSQVTGL